MSSRTGPVHVATTRRKYKGKVYETHLLRRTYREEGKVKHETVGNISHLPFEIIEIVRRALKGEIFSGVQEDFAIVRSLPHGHVAAVLGMIQKLKLETIISPVACNQRDLVLDRGRTAGYPTAPSQIPACDIIAPGSSGLLASARARRTQDTKSRGLPLDLLFPAVRFA